MKNFGKVLTAMITPFNDDFSVNYEEAARLAEYLVNHGSDGLVVAGSTGEAATMSSEEKLKLFATVVEAVGNKAAVIGGTGSNDTRASIAFTKAAEKTGIQAAMLVGPYYNKPPQEGFYQHFKAVAESTELPLVVYNVPGRTASNILPETIARLAKIKNIVAVKEASGNLGQISEVIRTTPDDFLVYSGDDALTLPILAIGGRGIISVASHIIGRQMQAMVTAFYNGETQKAEELHRQVVPFCKAMFITTNPIPVKAAVNILGFKAGPTRLPLVAPTSQEIDIITRAMQAVGTI